MVLEWKARFGDVLEEWGKQADVVIGDYRDEIDGG